MKKIILLVALMAGGLGLSAQEKPIHEIHAAMLYNFIKYVQWPNEADGGEFVVGVIGNEEVYKTLKGWYDGKPKGTKKYVIKSLTSAEEAATCAVVYIGKGRAKDFDGVKNASTGKPVLTITDSVNLGQKGSCINFKVIDGKLKFELNQAAVAASSLKVSSQLTSMAIVI